MPVENFLHLIPVLQCLRSPLALVRFLRSSPSVFLEHHLECGTRCVKLHLTQLKNWCVLLAQSKFHAVYRSCGVLFRSSPFSGRDMEWLFLWGGNCALCPLKYSLSSCLFQHLEISGWELQQVLQCENLCFLSVKQSQQYLPTSRGCWGDCVKRLRC